MANTKIVDWTERECAMGGPMKTEDIQAFFAEEAELDMGGHVVFTYLFETARNPKEAAAELASEQSTAQWQRPGIIEDFRPAHAAKVISLNVLDESFDSVFRHDGQRNSKNFLCKVRLAHPHRNFGPRIPNLLTAAMGEGAFFTHGIEAIKLVDIEFPSEYLSYFKGPSLGVKGIRELLDVHDRPLFFGVVKPNVGLDPKSFAKLAYEAWVGGLDAAKDDEMLGNPDYSPFEQRMRLVGRAKAQAEKETGAPKMFIANITDEVGRLKELHDIAVEEGINAVMLNVMAVGLSAVRDLAEHSAVPVIAHFDCIAALSRHPYFGVSTTVLTKLQRMCGCDAVIMPGFGARMMTPDEEVLANCAECSMLLGNIEKALPVPGGSDWAGTLPMMYEKLRTPDFAMVPGRGVFGHPQGPRAGAASLIQAWEAVATKTPLEEYAEDRPELQTAIEAFGPLPTSIDNSRPIATGFTGVPLNFGLKQ